MANIIPKTWSYAEITRVAEIRIKQTMERRAKSTTTHDRFFHETLALGIYMGWDTLTWQHQNPGDKERLEKLTEPT